MSHARLYVVRGVQDATLPEEVQKPSADVEHFIREGFGIDDARSLRDRAHLRPSVRTERDFLVSFTTITSEAQNALLKLFEEPPATAVFHIVVQSEELFIPTLRSRLLLVQREQGNIDRSTIRTFLQQTHGERIAEIADRAKAKDTAWMEEIVSGAEEYAVHQKGSLRRKLTACVVWIRQYFGARGSSSKMLLEELALTLPTKK